MKIYAVTHTVPDDSRFYLTPGKRYLATPWSGNSALFEFVTDSGQPTVGAWVCCQHLSGGDWERIEEPDDPGMSPWTNETDPTGSERIKVLKQKLEHEQQLGGFFIGLCELVGPNNPAFNARQRFEWAVRIIEHWIERDHTPPPRPAPIDRSREDLDVVARALGLSGIEGHNVDALLDQLKEERRETKRLRDKMLKIKAAINL